MYNRCSPQLAKNVLDACLTLGARDKVLDRKIVLHFWKEIKLHSVPVESPLQSH